MTQPRYDYLFFDARAALEKLKCSAKQSELPRLAAISTRLANEPEAENWNCATIAAPVSSISKISGGDFSFDFSPDDEVLIPWIDRINNANSRDEIFKILDEFRPGDWTDSQRAKISRTYIPRLERLDRRCNCE